MHLTKAPIIGNFTDFQNRSNPDQHLPSGSQLIPESQENDGHLTAETLKAEIETAIGTPSSRDLERMSRIIDACELEESSTSHFQSRKNHLSLHNLIDWLTLVLRTIASKQENNTSSKPRRRLFSRKVKQVEANRPVLIEIAKNIWDFFTTIRDHILDPEKHANLIVDFEESVFKKPVESRHEHDPPRTIEQLYNEVVN